MRLDRFSSLAAARGLIVVAVLITFGSLLRAEFLTWDDWFNLSHNPWLNPPTWATLAHYWTSPAYGLYVPVTYTAWAAVAEAGYVEQADPAGVHLNPYLFHAANIAVHLVGALVAFEVLRLLKWPTTAACMGALLFALHPVQVESVAWTAGLKDVLAGTLGLTALLLYLRAATGSARHVLIYVAATAVFGLSMLAKPSALVIAPMALVIDRFLIVRPWRTVLAASAPWLVLALGCGILGMIVQPATGVTPAPLWQRPLIVADAVQFYLGRLLWPQWLGIDYGRTPAYLAASGQLHWTRFLPLIGSLFALVFADRKMWIGAAIFLIALAPTSGAVTFLYQYYSTVADHYLYLPMFGVALAMAQIFVRARPILRPLMVTGLVAVAVRSGFQARYWKDDWSLFERALRVNSQSFLAWNNLGQALLNANNVELAEKTFRKSIAVKPDDAQAQTRLGELLEARGECAEAIKHRRAALAATLKLPPEVRTNLLATLNALVRLHLATGQRESAKNYQAQAERLAPRDPDVIHNARRLTSP